jgi:hypothetical protein
MKRIQLHYILLFLFIGCYSLKAFALPLPTDLSVAVSNNSGSWQNPSTWTWLVNHGNNLGPLLIPNDSTFVIIQSGHTVSLTANARCESIVVESSAVLDNSSFELKLQLMGWAHGINEMGIDNGVPYFGYAPIDETWDITNTNNANWNIYKVDGIHTGNGQIIFDLDDGTYEGKNEFGLTVSGNGAITNTGAIYCIDGSSNSSGVKFNSACDLVFHCDLNLIDPDWPTNGGANLTGYNFGTITLTADADFIAGAEMGTFTNQPNAAIIIENGSLSLCPMTATVMILNNEGSIQVLNGNVYISSDSFVFNSGSFSVNGDILGVDSQNQNCFFSQYAEGAVLTITGAIFPESNIGTLTCTGLTDGINYIIYHGTTPQIIVQPSLPYQPNIADAYSVLVCENPGGLFLNSNINVQDSIIFNNGVVDIQDHQLVIEEAGALSGSPGSTSMVVTSGTGELVKQFNAPGSFLYPLGDNTGISAYTPVSITLSSGVMTSGYVGVRVVGQSYPGSSGSYLNRYWEITSGGITDYTGDVSLTYSQQDVVGEENIIYCYRVSPTTDLFEPANTEMNQLTANGLTSFGTFTGHQQDVAPPLQFTVTGGGEYCSGSEGLPVGLSGSQTGVVYTLYRDGEAQSPTVDGTGEALDFGLQTSGVYTVTGFNNGGTTSMAGQAQIVELASPEVSVVIDVSENDICAGSSVTFTSQVINGGNATYQWYVNDQPVGSNQASYTYTPQSGDNVYVEVFSDIACATNNPAVSNSIMMVVNEYPVAVSITADNNPNCSGTAVTFTANVSNGGNTAYQWYVNSVALGDNQATYSYVAEDGDQIYVVVTSDLPCATNNPATSDTIEMIVNETLSASVSILPDNDTVCSGDSVIVTAYPVNGGSANYQWYKNDIAVGSNQSTYTFVPENMDEVKVVMTSGLSCAVDNPATSNTITLTVNPLITADVGIVADADQVCDGTLLGFLALPNGAGSSPVFQWYVNGQEVGESAPTFSYIPQNNDSVYLLMYSSLTCPSNNPSISNTVHVQVNPLPEVSWPVFDPDTLCNEWEPVELYGAIPAGGVYTGEGVVNGWFDPELAGVGTHEIQYTFVDGNGCTNSTTRELYVDVCQTIPEMNEEVSVYPNPVSESLTVLIGTPTGAYDVSLINVLGERVFHQKRLKQERINIPMQGFRNGVYVLRIKSPHKIICETIIKQ